VNKGRRKRKIVDDRIEMREWREHFMRLLGGLEHRVKEGEGRRREEEEEEISREEIKEAIMKLREGKAAGIDGMPGEVWIYGGEELTE